MDKTLVVWQCQDEPTAFEQKWMMGYTKEESQKITGKKSEIPSGGSSTDQAFSLQSKKVLLIPFPHRSERNFCFSFSLQFLSGFREV
ncbi:hypothetical protein [Algoriphagus boritolerans]|uniref:hypothetical protein n=1 Tax=Algoriphagus boritolerans TaxID=308111 RepID=UPI000B05766F